MVLLPPRIGSHTDSKYGSEMESKHQSSLGHKLKVLRSDRNVRLDNVTCVYCGIVLEKEAATREHVIGRKFVPKGKLENQWNLVVNSCGPCNNRKSDLEDDISAITMQPDQTGQFAHDDEDAATDARRKANKASSRRTKKLVKDSQEQIDINAPWGGGASVTFKFTSPAQINQERVFELARLHLVAFFYWITFDEKTQRGGFWQDGGYPVMTTGHRDWGNGVMLSFAEAVVDWEPRVFASTADGFFKIVIRRHPQADCWSWAIEWNLTTRTIGFFGELAAAKQVVSAFPKLQMETVNDSPARQLRYRTETPLKDTDDVLFWWDDGLEEDSEP